jgi:hypothetical protein
MNFGHVRMSLPDVDLDMARLAITSDSFDEHLAAPTVEARARASDLAWQPVEVMALRPSHTATDVAAGPFFTQ